MSPEQKISTGGGQDLGQNPFAALKKDGLPQASTVAGVADPGSASASARPVAVRAKSRGRVDILRETGNRGGKTVTVATNFIGIGLPEKEQLAKKMRVACGCGGTVKDGRIEIQGDQRETVARILAEAGFQPVFAGG
jgi:translation initiation factor 1